MSEICTLNSDAPQQLVTCEACDGHGVEVCRITVYEPGCYFSHDSTDERACRECGGVGVLVGDMESD